MLFNSYEFLVFLAFVVTGFHLLARRELGAAKFGLAVASFLFYGWAEPRFVPILLASVLVNHAIGLRIRSSGSPSTARAWLVAGVSGNLALIGYHKYAGFFASTVNAISHAGLPPVSVALPLAISFFTFQQVAYLVDCVRREPGSRSLLDYTLFVTFFPQLIAGPIVHHGEVLPQFREQRRRPIARDLAVGTTMFVIGLFKKVVLADGVAVYADGVFNAAAAGTLPGRGDAWVGSLAYGFQIYLDFSGYSEMAIGLARLFGIRLPVNFLAPYRAPNIVEFWRRWHITLSRFLRDYLYIPLGGSRRGEARRVASVMVTMLLGGLWHGAGWTFVAWGGLHGALILANQAWRRWRHPQIRTPFGRVVGCATTFTFVTLGWVLFRAENFETAGRMFRAMFDPGNSPGAWSMVPADSIPILAAAAAACWLIPDPVELMGGRRVALDPTRVLLGRASRFAWRPSPTWAVVVGALAILSLLSLSRVSPFLYFRF